MRLGRAILAIVLVGGGVALVLALDVPNRIAALGSGSLDRMTRPTTEATWGQPVRLTGRADRPSIEVTAQRPVQVRSATPGVRARRGDRLLGVPVTIRNPDELAWSTAQRMDPVVIDSGGASYHVQAAVSRARGVRVLSPAMQVLPSGAVRGVLVFEVPRRARPVSFRLTVGVGLTRTGAWSEGE